MKKIVDMEKWFNDYYQAIYCKQDHIKFDPCYVYMIREINGWLESLPDAEEKHGEWIYGEFDIPHCSECGKEVMPNNITPYCPYCGIPMD